MTLTDFLLARIAEDEEVAKDADRSAESSGDAYEMHPCQPLGYADKTGWINIDPARVLAECEAKRRIVEEYASAITEGDGPDVVRALSHCLMFLALPYADHPDYREEWKP